MHPTGLEVFAGLAKCLPKFERDVLRGRLRSVSIEDRLQATCPALGWAILQFSIPCWQTNRESQLPQTLVDR